MTGKMDRQTVLRLGGVASAAALVGGKYLGEPAAAWAMNPRFNTTLTLLPNGTVVATGPTGWAADETRARVYAHVAQASRIQSGATDWVYARNASWGAVLSGPALKAGPADAYGVAYVENQDGSYEWYPWEVAVTLR